MMFEEYRKLYDAARKVVKQYESWKPPRTDHDATNGDLISRDFLHQAYIALWTDRYKGENIVDIGDVLSLLLSVPAVRTEIVFCHECKVPREPNSGCPIMNGLIPDPYFFCANGVRKGE